MKDLNEVTLLGNVGKEADIKEFDNGDKLVRLRIATNRSYKDKDGEWQTVVSWHNVIVKGRAADRAAEFTKGHRLLVRGELSTREYTDKQGNQRVTTEVVVAGPGSFIGDQTPRRQAMAEEARRPPTDPQAPAYSAPQRRPEQPFEDDIPF